jgi:hypothetical protein
VIFKLWLVYYPALFLIVVVADFILDNCGIFRKRHEKTLARLCKAWRGEDGNGRVGKSDSQGVVEPARLDFGPNGQLDSLAKVPKCTLQAVNTAEMIEIEPSTYHFLADFQFTCK